MGLYSLNLDELAKYENVNIEELKNKSYKQLESMIADMKRDKILQRNKRNSEDAEYKRLVLKYFEPVSLLRHWFSDEEIVLACAQTGVGKRDLCEERNVPVGHKYNYGNNEYIRTSVENVRQFDRHGNELLYGKNEMRDVYRVVNRYQGLCHGKVILYLLYGRYPELANFKFSAHEMYNYHSYEIYPECNVYVPLIALMSGNVDKIILRNREYCEWYNNGRYSPVECEKAFKTEKVLDMFDVIHDIGKKEYALGHFPIELNENNQYESIDGMQQKKISESEKMILIMNDEGKFELKCLEAFTLKGLVIEFLEMVKTDVHEVKIHICNTKDYLNEHGINMTINPNFYGRDSLKFLGSRKFDYSECVVVKTFGWMKDNECDITIRV